MTIFFCLPSFADLKKPCNPGSRPCGSEEEKEELFLCAFFFVEVPKGEMQPFEAWFLDDVWTYFADVRCCFWWWLVIVFWAEHWLNTFFWPRKQRSGWNSRNLPPIFTWPGAAEAARESEDDLWQWDPCCEVIEWRSPGSWGDQAVRCANSVQIWPQVLDSQNGWFSLFNVFGIRL